MTKLMVITYTGIHHEINEEQAIQIAKLETDGEIFIGGNMLKRKNISDIVSMNKYYESYPNKRPAYVDKYKDFMGIGMGDNIKRLPYNALSGIQKGLERHISNTGGADESRELLQKLNLKIELNKTLDN